MAEEKAAPQPVRLPKSKEDRRTLMGLLEDEDAVTLTYSQVRHIRKALTVGLMSYAEIDRHWHDPHAGPLLHPTGSDTTVDEFAAALMFVECD